MSYLSKVGIAMYKADFDAIKKAIAKNDDHTTKALLESAEVSVLPSENDRCVNMLAEDRCLEPDAYVVLMWDWMKWYEEFPEVRFIMDAMHKLHHYSYIRIGEETGDVEQDSRLGEWEDGVEVDYMFDSIINVSADIAITA